MGAPFPKSRLNCGVSTNWRFAASIEKGMTADVVVLSPFAYPTKRKFPLFSVASEIGTDGATFGFIVAPAAKGEFVTSVSAPVVASIWYIDTLLLVGFSTNRNLPCPSIATSPPSSRSATEAPGKIVSAPVVSLALNPDKTEFVVVTEEDAYSRC